MAFQVEAHAGHVPQSHIADALIKSGERSLHWQLPRSDRYYQPGSFSREVQGSHFRSPSLTQKTAALENSLIVSPNLVTTMVQLPWTEVAGAGLTFIGHRRKKPALMATGLFVMSGFSLNVDSAREALHYACSPRPVEVSEVATSQQQQVSTKESTNSAATSTVLPASTSENLATNTVVPSPTYESSPSPTHEVQKSVFEIAEAAIKAGAQANDPETWKSSEVDKYKEMALSPNSYDEKELKKLDEFVAAMRQADYKQLLSTNESVGIEVMNKFIAARFKIVGVNSLPPTANKENAVTILESLSLDQQLYLEMVRRASNKEMIYVTPMEIITMETDPDGVFQMYIENDEGVNTAVYGMWAKTGAREGKYGNDMKYTIPLFGKSYERVGYWLYEPVFADFGGVAWLPEGKTGLMFLMRDSNNVPHLHVVQVTNNNFVELDENALYIGGWSQDNLGQKPPKISLHTRYGDAPVNYTSQLSPLTQDELLTRLEWTETGPVFIQINEPSEQHGNQVENMFFDQETGLPIIGNSADRDDMNLTGIIFSTGKNVWP